MVTTDTYTPPRLQTTHVVVGGRKLTPRDIPPMYFLMLAHKNEKQFTDSDQRLAKFYWVTTDTVARWRKRLVDWGFISAKRLTRDLYSYRILRVGGI